MCCYRPGDVVVVCLLVDGVSWEDVDKEQGLGYLDH